MIYIILLFIIYYCSIPYWLYTIKTIRQVNIVFIYFRSNVRSIKPRATVGQAFRISSQIFQSEGFRGLYRGYGISLCTYGSNSALYWAFYYLFSELVEDALPNSSWTFREPLRIVTAGLLASSTAVVLTNPLDVVRTRFQLQVSWIFANQLCFGCLSSHWNLIFVFLCCALFNVSRRSKTT